MMLAFPRINRLRSSRLAQSDHRDISVQEIEHHAIMVASRIGEIKTENSQLTKNGLANGVSALNDANVELRDTANQVEGAAVVLDQLHELGASVFDGDVLREGYEGRISVSPILGKYSAKDAAKAQLLINRSQAQIAEYRDTYGVFSMEGVPIGVVSADESLKRGYLPSFREYMAALAENYKKTPRDTALGIGWGKFLRLVEKIARHGKSKIPKWLRKEMSNPENRPPSLDNIQGSDPMNVTKTARGRQNPIEGPIKRITA